MRRWRGDSCRPGRRTGHRQVGGRARYERNKNATVIRRGIWAILTDGASFPSWDSGVDRVEGQIAPGETIKVSVKANPGRTFPVKVTEFKPG
jgi:hypothetical protein